MKEFNDQILNYWAHAHHAVDLAYYDSLEDNIRKSMKFLKFSYPVQNDEELVEVLKICDLYHAINFNQDSIVDLFRKKAQSFDIALSLTNRCGNGCYHCSTNASLNKKNISVNYEDLKCVLTEMLPHTHMLYISCEGDPFYYNSDDKNIVDIIDLLLKLKYSKISLQGMPPNQERFSLLERLLGSIKNSHDNDLFFLSQISFNLYTPRAGTKLILKTDQNGFKFKECSFPALNNDEINERVLEIINNKLENLKGDKKVDKNRILNEREDYISFLNDFISSILALASHDLPMHFEVRGDNYNDFTGLNNTMSVFQMILGKLIERFPKLNFRYNVDSAYIIPLGRAANLFPDGVSQEQKIFEKHIQMNSSSYLCDNWMHWNSITIDTSGYPQLCYSNLALSPIARTRSGPNLYEDGFDAICDFYFDVFKERISFLKENLKRLVSIRPNNHYCPLNLFKHTLQKFIR
jgi:hypothetical protein